MNSVSSALSFTLLHEAKLLHFVQLEDSIKTLYKTMLTPPKQKIFLTYFSLHLMDGQSL